jgi:hypothetical protein
MDPRELDSFSADWTEKAVWILMLMVLKLKVIITEVVLITYIRIFGNLNYVIKKLIFMYLYMVMVAG